MGSSVLLDSAEICKRLGVGPQWISQEMWRIRTGKVKAGTLPPLIQIGTRYMCYEHELAAWIESRRVGVPS